MGKADIDEQDIQNEDNGDAAMVEQKEKAEETTKFLGQEVTFTRLTREEVKRKLALFEAKYGMTSQEFSTKWNAGELDCAIDDHWDWDFYYEALANNSEIRTFNVKHLNVQDLELSED